ncbi:MAG: TlpA family protein disulfide reductase, partial [Bacteroidales bacterium]|nr:TlpA family protein disulfide reductase [Bacteroidales bacterium]
LREVETDELLHPQGLLPRWAATYFCDIVRIEDIAQNGIVREASKKADQQLILFKGDCAVIDAINASDDVRQIMKTERFLLLCKKEITPKREKFLRSQLTPDAFGQFRNYINGMNAKFEAIPVEQVKALEETPLDSLVDGKEIFQKLISPYRGEVIYVDIWGTWCGPCQREMTFLPQLHDAIDDLPVVCMYLANKSPEELWRKASRRFGIDGKDCVNLRLPDNQQRAVEDFLGVQGYPTYLLVAPDGTISTDKAPRPSAASEVRKAIEALLEK